MEKITKILCVCPSYYPALKYGGPIQSVHILNKVLVQKGVNIDVYTTNAGLEGKKDIPINKWVNLEGVNIKYFRYFGYEHFTFSPEILFSLFLNVKKYDIIHINAVWNFPVLAASLACLTNNKPYIITPHGSIYEKAINIKSKNIKMIYYKLIVKYYIEMANVLHFTTEDERDEVISYLQLKNKSVSIPNGIYLPEFDNLPLKGSFKNKYIILKGKRYILFLGRVNSIKGIDILVKSFHMIANKYKDLFLVIAGPDNDGYGETIRKYLRSNGLLDRVIFTGMLNCAEKIEAYVDAEVFILPSYSENFGMVVIEAMACGCPVIISEKVGLAKEIKNSKSGIVIKTDPGELTDAINNIFTDNSLKNELIENGKEIVENNYSIDKVADKIINMYESAIN